jgi:hypothetical protein
VTIAAVIMETDARTAVRDLHMIAVTTDAANPR